MRHTSAMIVKDVEDKLLGIAHVESVEGYCDSPEGADEANARLIAAAPALRDALANLLAWLDEDYPGPSFSREATLRQAAHAVLDSTKPTT
jgi:hypothetical protein